MKTSLRKIFSRNPSTADASLPAVRAQRRPLLSACFSALLSVGIVIPGSGNAGTIHNGWNYAIDSFTDGSGGPQYEELGLAFRQSGSTGYFAISGGMPLAGVTNSGARNGRIAPGDLFLNFSSHNLTTDVAYNDPRVFGVRFAAANDSLGSNGSNTTLGLFTALTVVNLAPGGAPAGNIGYATFQQYLDGFSRIPQMGDLSTAEAALSYLGNGAMYPNIASGTQLVDTVVESLTKDQLLAEHLDFDFFGATGPQVFGFKFDLSALPFGSFTAHFFEECINDGIALQAEHVPEPGTLALLGLGLAGITLRRRR